MDGQVSRQRMSEWTPAHEDELLQRVVTSVHKRLGNSLSGFLMSGREGGLILHGRVTSYYCKQLAQEVVMEESGLSIVANEIEVQGSDLTQNVTADKDVY